jgi:uncharacterized protein YoxC
MSTLLEQAIVDAKALKEAALKNAEATIIDKYSEEVKSTLNRLLEQDELSDLLGGAEAGLEAPVDPEAAPMEEGDDKEEIAEGVPMAFTEDIEELDGVSEGDQSMVEVDFAELEEAIKALREQIEEDKKIDEAKCDSSDKDEVMQEEEKKEDDKEEVEITKESIASIVSELLSEEEDEEVVEEEVTLEEEDDMFNEAFIDAIMEKLTVDTGATLSGWAGRSDNAVKYQMELEMAHRRTTEVEEELEVLKKAQEELVFENKNLKDSLANHREAISTLKESVQDVNLSNARLLYTNRVLRDTSLNERQKTRIVEAISKAGSVEEAKTIHETLQSTVAAAPKASPQSLSEAITRPTSIIRASRKEEPKSDPFSARLRKLAGIE